MTSYKFTKIHATWTGAGGSIELHSFVDRTFMSTHFDPPSAPDDHLRDGEPQPGRYARNGVSRSLLPRRHGPPRDEGAWVRRLAEIRREREAENAEVKS